MDASVYPKKRGRVYKRNAGAQKSCPPIRAVFDACAPRATTRERPHIAALRPFTFGSVPPRGRTAAAAWTDDSHCGKPAIPKGRALF